eukprot:1351304-Rhodomonas_salina.1
MTGQTIDPIDTRVPGVPGYPGTRCFSRVHGYPGRTLHIYYPGVRKRDIGLGMPFSSFTTVARLESTLSMSLSLCPLLHFIHSIFQLGLFLWTGPENHTSVPTLCVRSVVILLIVLFAQHLFFSASKHKLG